MGRRSRQKPRNRAQNPPPPQPVDARRERMARVAVADEVWAEFRAIVAYRPISAALGDLVEREVERHQAKRLREGRLEDRELHEALERARFQQAELAAIVDRLEALHSKRA